MDTYITPSELRDIAMLIEHLNDTAYGMSFQVGIYDANGENMGYVRIGEEGSYAYHTEAESE